MSCLSLSSSYNVIEITEQLRGDVTYLVVDSVANVIALFSQRTRSGSNAAVPIGGVRVGGIGNCGARGRESPTD